MGGKRKNPFNKIGHERGTFAENIIERIFKDRFQTGDVPKWLTGYERATLEDDSRGIDGWFYTDVGKIPLQIKSSRTGKRHAAEKNPNIPTVIVRAGDSENTIFSQCISAIGPERKKYLKERQIEE